MANPIGAFIGKLFGTEKAVASMVDGVKGGMDALFYTKQEKTRDEQEFLNRAADRVLEWIDKSQGQNIARRMLAIIIAGTWLSQYAFATILSVSAIWVEKPDKITASAEIIGANADGMTGAMMLILGFYFAAPHLAKIVGPAMERFGSRKFGDANVSST
jgi:hypothetical protein